jgi:lipopolysaccharide transport system permease protein
MVSVWKSRSLVYELTKRDFIGRYKGSVLGIGWSLFNPLLMLAVYTIVFSVVFKTRWGIEHDGKLSFAVVLFSGIIVHTFFSECINRAPSLVLSNPSFVKKVVFPIEILPIISLCSALLHFFISFFVLLIFCLIAGTKIHYGVFLLPIIILPLILMALGSSWILASVGVYIRDIAQSIAMISTVLLFMAPIFYPITALPIEYQALLKFNPITLPVNQLRDVMLYGANVNWFEWLTGFSVGVCVCVFGYWWFQYTKKGFSDVI